VPPRESRSKNVALLRVVVKAVAEKVAAKLVVTENVVANAVETKLAATADVDLVTATVLADHVTETANVLADLVLLAMAMASVRIVATAPIVVIVDPAKVVVAAPALVAQVVAVQVAVDLLKVSDEKAAPVVLRIQKRCSHASTRTVMAN